MPHLPSSRRVSASIGALVATTVLVSGCGLELMAQEEARARWSETYAVTRGVTLEIQNTNGQITVEPADADAIEVVAERIARASTEARAKEAVEGIEIVATVGADRVRLESRMRSVAFGINRTVNYTIKVPRWVNVELRSTNGNIQVAGLQGRLRVEATNGRIEARDLENGATVDTTNGAVSLDFARLGDQGIDCETTNGAITLTLPRDADADVSARVQNGAISMGDLELSLTEESRRRVDGRLGAGGIRVRLETTNGAIRLRGR
jgi:hypothetical protein